MAGKYTWLNPPPGEYSTEEYLRMVEYWRDSTSVTRNELSLRGKPMNKKFLGDKRVIIVNEFIVRLEAI